MRIDPTDINRTGNLSRASPFRWRGHTGTACLLIHGLTSTPYEVRELAEHLHTAGHTVFGPLLPGHGRRLDTLAQIRWSAWTDAVETELQTLYRDHRHVIVGGSSMGASLALWLASRHPVSGVIGLGTPYALRPLAYAAYLLRYLRPIIPKVGGSSIADPIARRAHPSYLGTPTHSVVEMIRLLRAVHRRLPDVTAPLLLLHAWDDPVMPRGNAIAVYERVGSRRKNLVWLYHSAHIVTEDYEKHLVFKLCTNFVETVTTQTKTA